MEGVKAQDPFQRNNTTSSGEKICQISVAIQFRSLHRENWAG
jgi:hypothetical protein